MLRKKEQTVNEFNQVVVGNSLTKEAWKRLKKNKMAVFGMVVVIIYAIISFSASFLPIYPYDESIIDHQHLRPSLTKTSGELLTKNHYIHADETRIEVLNSEGCKKPKQAYMWVYTTTKWNSKSIRFFEYANGRGGKFPKEFLKDYQGYLHTDCYGGYNDLEDSEQTPKYSPPKNNKKIKRCLCLVHLRRYFVDALEGKNKGKLEDSLNNKLALKAISMLDRVFANEREYKALTAEERQKARLENTKPILEEFFEWCIN